MTEAQKIDVIMHEYHTLCDEIIQRNSAMAKHISIVFLVALGALTIMCSGSQPGCK